MLKRILAGVILALILTGGAVAGPFEEGDAAYQRATMRVRLWRPLAEQGNATAQFRGPVGRCRGSKWYRLPAESAPLVVRPLRRSRQPGFLFPFPSLPSLATFFGMCPMAENGHSIGPEGSRDTIR
jgi:hypothetical protein